MANEYTVVRSPEAVLATNKVIRNTYTLLSMTLLFSALTASVSMYLAMPPATYFICLVAGLLLVWFVLPKTQNSAAGIGVVFAFTGLLGFGLGPILLMYLAMANGPQIVAMALAGTGVIFLSLSGYALVSRRDFSFMGGFLFTGLIAIIALAVLNIFLDLPAMSLALSAGIILLFSGYILFDTGRMIQGGETNYIRATAHLYISIFNIFLSLLHLLGFASDD